MKKSHWLITVGLICFAALSFSGWRWLENERLKASRYAVYQDMDAIRKAVAAYTATNGNFPGSLETLVPALLPSAVLHPPARKALGGSAVVVPENPYEIRPGTNGFEISCIFHGKGYSRVIMNSAGEVRLD